MDCKFKPTNYVHAAKPDKRYLQCSRAECGKGVFVGKGQRPGAVKCRHPSIGAGDVVATVAEAIGFKETPGCGCARRRKLLNELLSFPRVSLASFLLRRRHALPDGLRFDPIGTCRVMWLAWRRVSAIAFAYYARLR